MLSDLTYNSQINAADLPSEDVIFGGTEAMQRVKENVDCAVRNDLPLIIEGESGTGKEVVAKYLHSCSHRPEAPFVKVSCGVIPPASLESELLMSNEEFVPGVGDKQHGLIGSAQGGTLFLDDVGDLDSTLQFKLLRLLQSRGTGPAEGVEQLLSRLTVVCATNVDAKLELGIRPFHRDLFCGDRVIRVRLSTLRERRQDIPVLCEYLMQEQARRFGKSVQELTLATLEILKQWHWPGNLRELENWIARVVILGSPDTLIAEFGRQLVYQRRPDQIQLAVTESEAVPEHMGESRAVNLKSLCGDGWSRRVVNDELRTGYRAVPYRSRGTTTTPRRRRSHTESPPA